SRTTDVLTCAFRMWRCRLCGAENGLEMKLSEPQASLLHFPFFDLHRREPARAATLRRLLLLPFLGEARKGSSRRSTTGQQSHINERNKNTAKSKQAKNSKPKQQAQRAYPMRPPGQHA
ncbi:MAG: hypothetical protein NTY70_17085, partial [Burkholderiales bacterium]|nr:hypothetical protein [Burkholderiales bacterium]